MSKPIITLNGLTIVQRAASGVDFNRTLPTSGATLLSPTPSSGIYNYASATTAAGKFEWQIEGPFVLDAICADLGAATDYTIYLCNTLLTEVVLLDGSGQYINATINMTLPSSSWIEVETRAPAALAAKWVSVRAHKC